MDGIEEMFRIYLCYVTRGTRATRLGDRGWATIDDLWTIAWSVSGGLMAELHDAATGASDVEYSRVQFRRISLALRDWPATVLRHVMVRARCSPHAPLFGAASRRLRHRPHQMHRIDIPCAWLRYEACATSFPRSATTRRDATRAVISRVNAT